MSTAYSIHQELFNCVFNAIKGDSTDSLGLSNPSAPGYLRGDINRYADAQRTSNPPYLIVATTIDDEYFSIDGIAAVCTVEFQIKGNRDTNTTNTGGTRDLTVAPVDAVAARLLTLFNNCPPTIVSGNSYRISSFRRIGGGLAGFDGKETTNTERYRVVVSSLPAGGSSADQERAFRIDDQSAITYGINGPLNLTNNSEIRRYLTVGSSTDAIPTGVDHPGNQGNYTIARSVTRERRITKDCAIWAVTYQPIQVNYDKPVPMSKESVTTEDLDLVAWKFVADGSNIFYVPYYTKVFRANTTRSELIVKYGDATKVAEYQNHVANNVGRVRSIDGVNHIFTGASVDFDLATSAILIRANFWTNGEVKAWTTAPDGGSFDVPSPSLDPLMVFSVRKPGPNPVNPTGQLRQPSVVAVPISALLETGDFSWITA